MKFVVISAFTESMMSIINSSILYSAQKNGLIDIKMINIKDYGLGKRSSIDDRPFGGGAGMVLRPEPLYDAIYAGRQEFEPQLTEMEFRQKYWLGEEFEVPVIFMTPHGRRLNHQMVQNLYEENKTGVIIVCGHYEGIDQRIRDHLINREISLGDFVLSGGEIPALALIDSIARLVPNVLGNEESLWEESFTKKLGGRCEYPHFTRPALFQDIPVPQVLQEGHHAKILQWREDNLSG